MGRERRNWTEEEDLRLREAVRKASQESRPLLWRELAREVPGRTNKDCRRRWCNVLAGGMAKGSWTESEDERLSRAVDQLGPKWVGVADLVRTRNSDQCASHWTQILSPDINYSDFTPDEDDRLFSAVQQYGTNWTSITSSAFPDRTPLALKNRYSTLSHRTRNLSVLPSVPKVKDDQIGCSKVYSRTSTQNSGCTISNAAAMPSRKPERSQDSMENDIDANFEAHGQMDWQEDLGCSPFQFKELRMNSFQTNTSPLASDSVLINEQTIVGPNHGGGTDFPDALLWDDGLLLGGRDTFIPRSRSLPDATSTPVHVSSNQIMLAPHAPREAFGRDNEDAPCLLGELTDSNEYHVQSINSESSVNTGSPSLGSQSDSEFSPSSQFDQSPRHGQGSGPTASTPAVVEDISRGDTSSRDQQCNSPTFLGSDGSLKSVSIDVVCISERSGEVTSALLELGHSVTLNVTQYRCPFRQGEGSPGRKRLKVLDLPAHAALNKDRKLQHISVNACCEIDLLDKIMRSLIRLSESVTISVKR